jgi:hypothetical protein
MQDKNTKYNTLQAGKDLWDRMAALFLGQVPGESESPTAVKKSEHSKEVAERYGAIVGKPSYGSITAAIARCEAERKNYRKYAKESLATIHDTLLAHTATLKPPKDTDNTATFDGGRFMIVAKDATGEADRTVGALLDMLARATDEDLLEEAQRKGRNGQVKLLAELDAKKYGDSETIEGGNEYYKGSAAAAALLWDNKGIMKGILKLTTRGTRALDRNDLADAGEMYAVLNGDLPFRKDDEGNPVSYIGLSPNVTDTLFKGRCYQRIAEALAEKIKELNRLLEAGTDEQNSVAIGNFASGQFDDSMTKMKKEATRQAIKDANKPLNLDIPKVPAITPTPEVEAEQVAEVEENAEVTA